MFFIFCFTIDNKRLKQVSITSTMTVSQTTSRNTKAVMPTPGQGRKDNPQDFQGAVDSKGIQHSKSLQGPVVLKDPQVLKGPSGYPSLRGPKDTPDLPIPKSKTVA